MKTHEYLSVRIERPDPFSNINLMITPPGFYMTAHTHPFYHINRILTGSVCVELDGKFYDLGVGCTFVLPPNRSHTLRSAEGYAQIGVDVECVDDSRGIGSEIDAICGGFAFKKIPISSYEATERIAYMRSLLSTPTKGNRMRAVNLAECQVLDLLEALRNENSDDFVEQFTMMISQYDPWQLKLSDISRILGLSRTQLERKAKYAFGCGASEYCARVRYTRVCQMLKSDRTLECIAEECGFYDVSHLSKFFSARAGIPPGEYRKNVSAK